MTCECCGESVAPIYPQHEDARAPGPPPCRLYEGRPGIVRGRNWPSRATSSNQNGCATQVCYDKYMPSVTSSFRMSKELQRELSDAAERTGKVKNAIIVEALGKYLHTMERESLSKEARRQSELVSRNDRDADWYGMADTSGWR